MSDDAAKLFVYGTLCPGRPNAHVLDAIGGSFEGATIRGFLHEEGWGAALGFPAIQVDNAGDPVAGFVFSSVDLPRHWEMLDDFEGPAYERRSATVTLDSGEQVSAFVYQLRL